MVFFAIGLAIALLAGWILIGLLKIVFGLLGVFSRGYLTDKLISEKAEALERR